VSVSQPVDSSILHEIVRIVESRRKVPEKVVVKSREYLLTYLEDHQRRMEEALTRYDADRLNMLYGQLASKIKYQLLRRLPARPEPSAPAAKKAAASKPPAAKKPAARKSSRSTRAAARPKPARKVSARKPAKKAAGMKRRASAKRTPAKRGKTTTKRRK
jgi:hypothetical protein